MLMRSLPALAVVAVLAAAGLAGCSDDSGSSTATDGSAPSCSYQSDGRPPAKEVDPPPDHATVSGEEQVTLHTSAGDIGATLDADAAPCTVNSFVSLADQKFFDGTPCHRLTTQGIFVLQCGDPTGTGGGGPGYSFDDELTGKESYGAGTLAMANAGEDTNGSQFFIVYGDTQLPPSYTVFGQVDDEGLKTVQQVAKKGTADGGPDGAPKEKVTIETVDVG